VFVRVESFDAAETARHRRERRALTWCPAFDGEADRLPEMSDVLTHLTGP